MYTKMEYVTMLLVVGMVALAQYVGVNDVIFPEIAALAFGAWVMEDRPWPGAAWTIWFSPTLGAATGVLIVHCLATSLVLMVVVAFLFVLLELKVCRSAMSPSFSAAILPIIAHVEGWVYPASVCLATAVIALLTHRNDKRKARNGQAAFKTPPPRSGHETHRQEWVHYGKLALFIAFVAALCAQSDWLYIMSPPLIVAFIELNHPGCALRRQSMPRFTLLLFACALAGTLWLALVTRLASGPPWLAAGLAVATALLLAKRLRLASPPALALALIPTILPPRFLYVYPLQVLAGSLLFIAASRLWFKSAAAA
ncbi:MAG: hypothetical protein ACP59X_22640 [Solidesulfovibrio sp. DCME]|uniref:hypothetical protein n=1 Tax=Solidesulfovibrio sp. DCME TaxID=3447380 RepID=UPI003D137661